MKLKAFLVGLAALGGVAFTSGSVSAMPNGIPHPDQIAGQTANIQQARWVCNPWGRCFWRPNWYGAYGYYGPRRIYGPGPYWRWHRWHHWY